MFAVPYDPGDAAVIGSRIPEELDGERSSSADLTEAPAPLLSSVLAASAISSAFGVMVSPTRAAPGSPATGSLGREVRRQRLALLGSSLPVVPDTGAAYCDAPSPTSLAPARALAPIASAGALAAAA